MASKSSGLGRGLGDLLSDNTPSLRTQKPSVVVRSDESSAPTLTPLQKSYYQTPAKPLFEEKPKNRSIKSNFKK